MLGLSPKEKTLLILARNSRKIEIELFLQCTISYEKFASNILSMILGPNQVLMYSLNIRKYVSNSTFNGSLFQIQTCLFQIYDP